MTRTRSRAFRWNSRKWPGFDRARTNPGALGFVEFEVLEGGQYWPNACPFIWPHLSKEIHQPTHLCLLRAEQAAQLKVASATSRRSERLHAVLLWPDLLHGFQWRVYCFQECTSVLDLTLFILTSRSAACDIQRTWFEHFVSFSQLRGPKSSSD